MNFQYCWRGSAKRGLIKAVATLLPHVGFNKRAQRSSPTAHEGSARAPEFQIRRTRAPYRQQQQQQM